MRTRGEAGARPRNGLVGLTGVRGSKNVRGGSRRRCEGPSGGKRDTEAAGKKRTSAMPSSYAPSVTRQCKCTYRPRSLRNRWTAVNTGNVPGAVEILGGGLIAPEVILGAVKDKSRHEEDCHKSHQKNQ
jgi:hypothetical protein